MATISQWRVLIIPFRPSMSANTPEDSVLKTGLVDDVMTIVNNEGVYIHFYSA